MSPKFRTRNVEVHGRRILVIENADNRRTLVIEAATMIPLGRVTPAFGDPDKYGYFYEKITESLSSYLVPTLKEALDTIVPGLASVLGY